MQVATLHDEHLPRTQADHGCGECHGKQARSNRRADRRRGPPTERRRAAKNRHRGIAEERMWRCALTASAAHSATRSASPERRCRRSARRWRRSCHQQGARQGAMKVEVTPLPNLPPDNLRTRYLERHKDKCAIHRDWPEPQGRALAAATAVSTAARGRWARGGTTQQAVKPSPAARASQRQQERGVGGVHVRPKGGDEGDGVSTADEPPADNGGQDGELAGTRQNWRHRGASRCSATRTARRRTRAREPWRGKPKKSAGAPENDV